MERDILVADIEELENLDISEIHAWRLNAKEVITPERGEHPFSFPIADGTGKTRPRELLTLRLSPCLPVARSADSTTCTSQNVCDNVAFERTFHDIAIRCHQNCVRFVSVILDSHAGVIPSATWIHGFPSDSAPPLRAPLRTSIVIWMSASLRHSFVTPRAILTLLHLLSRTTCATWCTSVD